MPGLPSTAQREVLATKLAEFLTAIEAHPKWCTTNPDKGLFYIWDFVNRTKYMAEELDNIKDGKQLRHPE